MRNGGYRLVGDITEGITVSSYENRQELADKIDYEGGIYEMLFGYGLGVEDMPDGELRTLMTKIKSVTNVLEPLISEFEKLLPASEGY